MLSTILNFSTISDNRGSLISLEENHTIPFDIKRVYYIFNTQEGVRRGFHAHKNLKQIAICLSGSCKFLLDNGNSKEYIELKTPNQGLLIEGLLWREMYDFSQNCVLMVLADAYYDEDDYIRDYNVFIDEVKKTHA